jgi:hypothetical protein
MRQTAVVVALLGILVATMQCSDDESLSDVPTGRATLACPADTMWYIILPDTVTPWCVTIDTLIWMYDFPPGGPSSVSIILGGYSQLDLEVETYTDSVPGTVSLLRDSLGMYTDTVLIDQSAVSGIILPRSSRLFVSSGGQALDTIELDNPW